MKNLTMRDLLIEEVYRKMKENNSIFFVSADFGAPALDKLRADFSDRFYNVGIAEQNLIGVSAGLALEGFTVFAYAIAPFLTMRAYEQIRISLSILSQIRDVNVNMIGVGTGLSYDVTGPTHHCLEDTAILRLLPNMMVFSPSDAIMAEKFVKYAIDIKRPKYFRLDGKPLPQIYSRNQDISFKDGFTELNDGSDVLLVATGYSTHKALRLSENLIKREISSKVVDVFLLKPLNELNLVKILNNYRLIVTMDEAFLNIGSLDTVISNIIIDNNIKTRLLKFGFEDRYVFDIGNREYLHNVHKISEEHILEKILINL